jgi:hypothetical protein
MPHLQHKCAGEELHRIFQSDLEYMVPSAGNALQMLRVMGARVLVTTSAMTKWNRLMIRKASVTCSVEAGTGGVGKAICSQNTFVILQTRQFAGSRQV